MRLFRAFVTLSEELHFGRAADRLGIAQPALSLQIQSLEATLGLRLFDRSRRHVALSEAGRLFLPEARATLAQADRALRTAQRTARGEIGRLEIAFTGSAPFNSVMPQVISRFRANWPDVSLGLREMNTSAQLTALSSNSLDVGFVRPEEKRELAGLRLETLLREPLFVALAAGHPLAGRERLRVAELSRQPFILPPRHVGTGLYDKVVELCGAAGFAPDIVLEAQQLSTIVGLAATGLGLSVVPEAMRRVQLEGVRFIRLEDEGASLILATASRADDDRPVIRHFLAAAAACRTV